MDTLEQLLQQLQQYILNAKKSVFSSNDVIVNRSQILDMIDHIRASYPEVVHEAQIIVNDCDNQKQKTMNYCANMIQEAENRRNAILDESDIIKQANDEAKAIRKEVMDMRVRFEYDAKCKVDELLRDSEVTLRDALTLIRNNREDLRKESTPQVVEGQPQEEVAYNESETASNPN